MSASLPNSELQPDAIRYGQTAGALSKRHVSHWFFIGVGVCAILGSVAGFGPSIIDTSMRRGTTTPLVITHAVLVLGWLVLFTTQAYLVATQRTHVHRRVGVWGAVLAAAIIVVSFVASIETTRRGHDLSGDVARAAGGTLTPDGILFPIVSLINFAGLVAAALLYRRRPEIHKRLMLFAVLQPLVAEPITHLYGHLAGHWPPLQETFNFVAIPASLILLSVSAIHDRLADRRIHPVSIWVPIGLLIWTNVLFAVLLPSAVWLRAARQLIGAPA